MVMNTSTKTTRRLFSKHIVRFFTIIVIIIVSISFIYGILEVESKIKTSMHRFYEDHQMHDIYIKSKNIMGFTKDEMNYLEDTYDKSQIVKSFCYEMEIDNKLTRVYSYDLSTEINQLELVEGSFPNNSNEIVVERSTKKIKGYDIGDIVKINNREYTVSGIVFNPLMIIIEDEQSFTDENRPLENVIYFDQTPFMVNDIYIKLDNIVDEKVYDDNYEQIIDNEKEILEMNFNEDNATILSLYENYGFYSLHSYAEKVSIIGYVFIVFFCLITILVIYSTISRLMDEERSQNACLKTLGFTNYQIMYKYLVFISLAIIIGVFVSCFVGIGFSYIIYFAFKFQYDMPPFPSDINITLYMLISLGMLAMNLILVSIIAYKNVNHNPAYMLRPKAPKAGKKVILEYIKIIWNHLSFKYKSTFRNVLLFKSRFFMTVVSIMFCTMLVLAGIGILDCASKVKGADSLGLISLALIIFSGILCALVIYNLTNINVSERNREIATLMVLGYKDNEVTGYIYREIYIMSIIGAILGLPCGYVFMEFVFNLIDFGAISDINWWSWFIAPIITMIFSFLSTMLLRRRIVKTDMNASLKILE